MELSTLSVVGHLKSLNYHKAKRIIQMLVAAQPNAFQEGDHEGLMEFQWTAKKQEIKQTVSNNAERIVAEEIVDTAVFVNGNLSWTTDGLVGWIEKESLLPNLQESLNQEDFQLLSEQAFDDFISNTKFKFAYLKIRVRGSPEPLGVLTLQLYDYLCPKTVKNFTCLCTGEKGTTDEGVTLSYTDSVIHRIIPNGWIQGGDIVDGSGSDGVSIYGKDFPDESYAVCHDCPGIIGMANKGRNTNASQFYITLKPCPWMDGQYVAFGRVVEGSEVLKQIESLRIHNERPVLSCYISECGLL